MMLALWPLAGFHGGALKRAVAIDDLPEGLYDTLMKEYVADIAPLLLATSSGGGGGGSQSDANAVLLDVALRNKANVWAWLARRLHQTAFAAMPVGLLHDPVGSKRREFDATGHVDDGIHGCAASFNDSVCDAAQS